MIVIAGFILGAIAGAWAAKRRGGTGLDMVQYAAVYGAVVALIGLFVTIFLSRVA